MTSKPIRVIIADHDLEFSKRLKTFLDQEAFMQVVSMVRDGQGAIDACREILPDLVLVDLHLPVVDGVNAIKTIVSQNENIKVLSVSDVANDPYALEAIKAGARGYVQKNVAADYSEIKTAIQQIANGEVVLNSDLAWHILNEFS